MITAYEAKKIVQEVEVAEISLIIEEIEHNIIKAARQGWNSIEIETWRYTSVMRNNILDELKRNGFTVKCKDIFVYDVYKKYIISWK